jgi:hypothetical protein
VVHIGQLAILLKGIALTLAAASAHHVTLIFGSVLFAVPVLWLAWYDGREKEQPGAPIIGRGLVFAAIAAVGVGIVLLPYWIAIIRHPIEQMPIPHASRSNFLMNGIYGMNYFIVPYGALILALPFIVIKGASNPRLRVLLLAFWVTFLIALGGTTPVPRWIFGRAFEILTYERFTLWATVLALPIVGLLVEQVIDRFPRLGCDRREYGRCCQPGAGAGLADVEPVSNVQFAQCGFGCVIPESRWPRSVPLSHARIRQCSLQGFDLCQREQRGWRVQLSPPAARDDALRRSPIDQREVLRRAGMDSLRAMLQHANHYGLKFIFVHDPFYEPLLVFGGMASGRELQFRRDHRLVQG